jgi:rSAM/selenodomain-associated transferase 2
VISVIIPTFDEEALLPGCLAALDGQVPHELIVADGGSSDTTPAIARAAGATIVVCGRGRAAQLDRGAAAARGDILLFVHADTRLPAGALARIEQALADDGRVVGGCFTLRFDDPTLQYRLMAAAGNVYHRLTRTQYGDRAMFVRRAAFVAAGGFRPLEIMEDVDLGRRLRRRGRTIVLRGPVITSAREFRRQGALRLVAKIAVAHAAFRLRVAPERIRRFYYGRQGVRGGERGMRSVDL